MKTCSKCLTEKPVAEFHRRGDKWQPMCKVCKKERSQIRYAERGDHIRGVNKLWRETHPEQMKDARAGWEAPKGYAREAQARCRATKLGAAIETAGLLAYYAACPAGYEVDHIRPLSKGGEHTLSNLQYLTVSENRTKSDKWEEYND